MSDVVAGWYDDGSGRKRWWDGRQWTEHFAPEEQAVSEQAPNSAPKQTAAEKAEAAAAATKEQFPDTIWSAVGRPLTGIGIGRYRLTSEYLFFERGTLSSKSQQIHVREIHDVDASATMAQKARGIGTITLFVQRTGGKERVVLEDIPNYRDGVSAINNAAHAAREEWRVKQSTQHVAYTGGVPGLPGNGPAYQQAPAASPAAGTSASVDLNAELAKLAAFRDSGVLDAEEFAAAKRKLLGL